MSQKIKIGFNGSCLAEDQHGGWARYTSELITHLEKSFSDQLEISIFENFSQQTHIIWEQKVLPQLCKDKGIQILHAPANGGLPYLGNFKKVLTIHDLFSEQMFSWPHAFKSIKNFKNSIRYKVDWVASLKAADLVITISEFSKQELLSYGLKTPISRIYEGVSPRIKGTAIPSQKPFLIYVGTFDSRKRTDDLINDFLKTTQNIDLVLVGREATLEEKRWSSPRLIFLENLTDKILAGLYNAALAFITYSKSEGFGLPMVEAMSFGKPVLFNGGGAIPEITGEGGLQVETGQLGPIIGKMLTDADYLKRISENATKQAKNFQWEVTAQETFIAYKKLLNSVTKS